MEIGRLNHCEIHVTHWRESAWTENLHALRCPFNHIVWLQFGMLILSDST